jgi:hypothetical protein
MEADSMDIPIIIGEEEAGQLRVTREGLYTVLEAELGGAEGLVRLWAHGEGGSAYLGLMQPRDGGLWFSRRLSRRELEGFPDPIEYVSDREDKPVGEAEPVEEEPETAAAALETEEETDDSQTPGTDARSCPWPAEPAEEGLLWYSRGDGTLVSFDGISSLVAFPAQLRKADDRAAVRVIEGKKYLVFRY